MLRAQWIVDSNLNYFNALPKPKLSTLKVG